MKIVIIGLLQALVYALTEAQIDPWLPMTEAPNPVLDVRINCDMNQRTMTVEALFSHYFGGYLYAKGFYNDRRCKALGSGRDQSIALTLPLDGCGIHIETTPDGRDILYYSNTIVIMNEAEWGLLGMMDTSYTVSCKIGGGTVQRFDYGFTVPMLSTVGSLLVESDAPGCSMKIVSGKDPLSSPTTLLFLGDHATIVFTADDSDRYDMLVSDCFVHDGFSGEALPLIDGNGCPTHRKIIGFTNYNTRLVPGQTYAYAHFKVFKFPDKDNVYFQCKCHVCFENCNRPTCTDLGSYKKRGKRQALEDRIIFDASHNDDLNPSTPKKNVTVDLIRQITVALRPEHSIESNQLPDLPAPIIADEKRIIETLETLDYPADDNESRIRRSCSNNTGVLIILTVLLGLLTLFFMTLSAALFHKSRNARKPFTESALDESVYSTRSTSYLQPIH